MAFKFIIVCSVLAIASAGVIGPVTYATNIANPAVDAIASTHQNVVRSFGGTVSQYSKAIDTPYSSVRKEDTRISNNVYTPAIAKTVSYAAPSVTYGAPAKTVYSAPAVTYAAPSVAYGAPANTVYSTPAATYGVPAKTVYSAPSMTYAAPAKSVYATPSVTYGAPSVSYGAPATYAAPTVTKTVYAAPAVAKTVYSAPTAYANAAPVYAQTAPVYSHSAPTAAVYTHASPVYTQSAPAVAKTVTYAGPSITNYNHGPAATTYTHNAPGVSGYGTSQTVHYSPANMVSHMNFDGFGTHWGW